MSVYLPAAPSGLFVRPPEWEGSARLQALLQRPLGIWTLVNQPIDLKPQPNGPYDARMSWRGIARRLLTRRRFGRRLSPWRLALLRVVDPAAWYVNAHADDVAGSVGRAFRGHQRRTSRSQGAEGGSSG